MNEQGFFSLSLWNIPVTPRQPARLTTTNAVEINRRDCKYLYGNNLPWISLIRGKLFLNRYCLLISVAFVVLCRAGCLCEGFQIHSATLCCICQQMIRVTRKPELYECIGNRRLFSLEDVSICLQHFCI